MMLSLIPAQKVYAGKPLDEIQEYVITVDVKEDASLDLTYHIEWKVLDDKSEGPLEWVKVGIPNKHCLSFKALSSNIKRIDHTESGGSYIRIDFDRAYHKDEIVKFDFTVNQDYMYQMNELTEGETVYHFIPGWFDDIEVKHVVVKWNSDKVKSRNRTAIEDKGYLMWEGNLAAGERFAEISVTYDNDAYNFILTKNAQGWSSSSGDDDDDGVVGFLFFFIFVIIIIALCVSKSSKYSSGSGFNAKPVKKIRIERTLVKYYPTCQGCGAVRPENAEKCEYCGRSFIESEEKIEETEVVEPEKYKEEGTFRYGNNANTYVRVHLVPYYVRPARTASSCAHSSCACACACACAGGGRAGCSMKDFYKTDLKLEQIKRLASGKKKINDHD